MLPTLLPVQVVGPFPKRGDAHYNMTTLLCVMYGEPATCVRLNVRGHFYPSISFDGCAEAIEAYVDRLLLCGRRATLEAMRKRFAPDTAQHGPHADFLRASGIGLPASAPGTGDAAVAGSAAPPTVKEAAPATASATRSANSPIACLTLTSGAGDGKVTPGAGAKRMRCAFVAQHRTPVCACVLSGRCSLQFMVCTF